MESCSKCNPVDRNSQLCENCLQFLQTRIDAVLNEELPKNDGYDFAIFADPVPKCYECSLCLGAFRDPVHIVDCGHVFCKSCLERATQNEKYCPNHRENPFTQTFIDQAKRREVLSLRVNCTKDGCSWNGDLSDLHDHLAKNCHKIQLSCLHEGCVQVLLREDLFNHLNDECALRLIRCNFCNLFITFHQMKEHTNLTCEEFPVICKFVCGKKIPRNKVAEHCLVCQKRPLPCLFADFGCPFTGEEKKLNTHLQKNISVHMKLTTKQLRDLRTNNHALLETVKDLSTKHEALLTKHEALLTKHEILQREFNEKNKTFYWNITNYKDNFEKATNKTQEIIYSPYFYTLDNYTFKLRADLNGNGSGKNTHTSLFFVLCKGYHDDKLVWPFNKKITFTILPQDVHTKDIVYVIVPANAADNKKYLFERPTTGENRAIGQPSLLPHTQKDKFIKDDMMKIKFVID